MADEATHEGRLIAVEIDTRTAHKRLDGINGQINGLRVDHARAAEKFAAGLSDVRVELASVKTKSGIMAAVGAAVGTAVAGGVATAVFAAVIGG